MRGRGGGWGAECENLLGVYVMMVRWADGDCTRTHAEVRVGQSRAEVAAQAAPALAAQHVGWGGAAEGLKSLPAHLHTESPSVT